MSTSNIASLLTEEKQNLAVKFNGMDELYFWEEREKKFMETLHETRKQLREEIKQLEREIIKEIKKNNVNKTEELNILKKNKEEEKLKIDKKWEEIVKNLQEKRGWGDDMLFIIWDCSLIKLRYKS